jgi:hypothetical protein
MNAPALIGIERHIETALSFMQGNSPENITARRELTLAMRELEALRRQEPGQDRRASARPRTLQIVVEPDDMLGVPSRDDIEDADVRRFIQEHPQLANDPRDGPRRLCAPEGRAA